jgi:transcriptional regulator with XRE-family HTH domain
VHPTPDEHFARTLATVLRETREKAGVSQKKLAELSGVGRSGIVTIEAGKRIPSVLICKMLADGLKVSLASLIAEVERRLNKGKRRGP